MERILALPPRPNQAFWTLSALWSAWLWGRETETRFSQVLGRRRFDWHWHTRALHQAFSRARELAGASSDMFLVIGEPSPGMLLATVTANHCAGFDLDGIAVQGATEMIQMSWRSGGDRKSVGSGNVQSIARSAIQEHLDRTGEPAEYMTLFAAVTAALAVNDGLPASMEGYTQEKSTEIQGIIARLFNDRDFLRRLDATSQELDSGKWGLVSYQPGKQTLADRVEIEIQTALQEKNTLTTAELQRRLNRIFKGMLTPSAALVEFCLRAYADWNPETGLWTIKAGEKAAERKHDKDEITKTLLTLGQKLGATAEGSEPITWKFARAGDYRIWVLATACVAGYCRAQNDEVEKLLVLPGSRAELLKYKLLRDPQLREATAHGWHFLKFRALRNLATRPDLSLEIWQMMLDSDPITLEVSMQLRMFG